MPAYKKSRAAHKPKGRVYFPKFVSINNPRLAILYWIVTVIILAVAIYMFVSGKRYLVKKEPVGQVTICSQLCPGSLASTTSAAWSGSSGTCGTLPNPNRQHFGTTPGGVAYNDVECANVCEQDAASRQSTLNARGGGFAGQPTANSCISPSQAVQYSASTIFIPTFYKERVFTQLTGVSGCPTGYTNLWNNQLCHTEKNYFVPGINEQHIEFSHKFRVAKPVSTILPDQDDERGDSQTNMRTILLNRDGTKKRVFDPAKGTTKVQMSVNDLLDAAGLHECCENEETGQALNLDEPYTRESAGVQTGTSAQFGTQISPTPRLTGVLLTMDIAYTNKEECRIDLSYDAYDGEEASGEKVACLSVRARRQWTQVQSKGYFAPNPSYADRVERTYSGILIDFHIHGSFTFTDGSAMFQGITTIVIWFGIPIWVLYFFSIYFLGKTSTIYNRVIHQELSLTDACVGLAGRLILQTSAFQEVQDFPEGISKSRLYERFMMIMQDSDLDATEVRKFVDFVFEGISAPTDADAEALLSGRPDGVINVQDFCSVCSYNEPVSFDALVTLFDRDRRLELAEAFFQDPVMDTVRSVDKNDRMTMMVAHAMKQWEGDGTNIRPVGGGKSAVPNGTINPDTLQQRHNELEQELRGLMQKINQTTLKEKTLLKQISNAEEYYTRLGGQLDTEAEMRRSQFE